MGSKSLSEELLPAAAIKRLPALLATVIASYKAWELAPPPQLLLVILKPIWLAYKIALTALSAVPEPLASKNLIAAILAFQFTPTTPSPLFPTAPIVPAT